MHADKNVEQRIHSKACNTLSPNLKDYMPNHPIGLFLAHNQMPLEVLLEMDFLLFPLILVFLISLNGIMINMTVKYLIL